MVASIGRHDYELHFESGRREQGDASAQVALGLMYDSGRGIPRDYAAAMTWYRKAADQHNASAQSSLGFMYALGHGVRQAAAMAWYRKAADQGDTSAQTALGFMYYDGQGVLRDNVVAHMWFNLAAAGGNLVAVRKRDAIEEKMTLAQIAEAQRLAREWKPTSTPR